MPQLLNDLMTDYDLENIAATELICRICFFDAADDGRIFASFGFKKKDILSGSIYDHLTESTASDVRSYLGEYGKAPMIIPTNVGTAILNVALFPSTSIGILMFPLVTSESLIRIGMTMYGDFFTFARELPKYPNRLTKLAKAQSDKMVLWRSVYDTCFRGVESKAADGVRRSISDELVARAHGLSVLFSCPVNLQCGEEIFACGNFNFSVYTMILMLVMSIAKKFDCHRGVSLNVECVHEEIIVTAICSFRASTSAFEDGETRMIKELLDRKGMLCDITVAKDRLSVSASPINKEWSLLGLKEKEKN